MPVRFNSPSLGEGSRPQLKAHQWQIDLSYRYLPADQWYVGSDVQESSAPFGKPLFLNINSLNISVDYGVTDRFSVTFALPFSHGTHSRFYADKKRHEVSAAGLGDMSFGGTVWLWNPAKHLNSNISLGLGVKTASGDNAVTDNFFLGNGSAIQFPVDQAIQLGDGGWGIIFQTQAYRKLFERASGYVYAWYLMTPKEKTNVPSPIGGVPLSVPDVYSTRLGMAYALWPARGLSASIGIRIDGIPIRDLAGGNDGFRRPGYSLYLDPGVSFVHGRSTFTMNIPVLVHQDFKRSIVDVQLNKAGGGDLARYLMLAEYSVRF
jgi:hypothetical protein